MIIEVIIEARSHEEVEENEWWYYVFASLFTLTGIIEMAFSYVKIMFKKQTRGISLNLKSKQGRHEVFKSLKSLTSNIIIEYYDNLLKEIKTQLDEARSFVAHQHPILMINK